MSDLSTKRIGYIGELAVTQDLISQGMNVYTPIVDDRGVDMVVETLNSIKKVQVKTISHKVRSSIEVRMTKYAHRDRVDVLAVYLRATDQIAYVPYNNEKTIILAITTAKNGQEKNRNWFYRYMEFPR